MFGLMKHFLKERTGSLPVAQLCDIHVGCVVGFGFMPQKNISGRRLPVTEVNSYVFDGDSFIAFRMEYGNADIQLIVAEGNEPQETYLAVSRRIEERLISPLFSPQHPRGWFGLEEGARITVNRDTLGMPAGWFARNYTVALKTKGRFLEGDHRLRKSVYTAPSRPFDYVLLVDDANAYALEVEQYEDGAFHVLSTVYRPATDIGEITRPQTRIHPNVSGQVPALPSRDSTELSLHAETRASESAKEARRAATLPPPAMQARREKNKDTIVSFTRKEPSRHGLEEAQMRGKFGRIQPSATSAWPDEMLACDMELARLVIEEARRNRLPLSELIRKVIDLPARIDDHILIPFALSDAEYGELARRYGLQPSDHKAVRQRILDELSQFANVKK